MELQDRRRRYAENIDWKLFLGPAPDRPFHQDRFFRWRKYWDYSGGIATDLFYHRLAPLEFAVGMGFPARVSAHGGIYVHKDREVPDTYATTIEYDDHYAVLSASMASSAANQGLAPAIYGHEASIQFVSGPWSCCRNFSSARNLKPPRAIPSW